MLKKLKQNLHPSTPNHKFFISWKNVFQIFKNSEEIAVNENQRNRGS